MKKSIIILSVLCCFPFFAYATQNDFLLTSPSISDRIGTFFSWILLISTPFLVLSTIVLAIKSLFEKSAKKKKGKKKSINNTNLIAKFILPYCVFAGMFIFSKHQIAGYSCDCFKDRYEKITADITAILFLFISIRIACFMKKNKKEWKALHTFSLIVSFLIAFYLIMAIGGHLYT